MIRQPASCAIESRIQQYIIPIAILALTASLSMSPSASGQALPSPNVQAGADHQWIIHHFDEPRELQLDPTRIAIFREGEPQARMGLLPGIETIQQHAISGWSLAELNEADRAVSGVMATVQNVLDNDSHAFATPVFVDNLGGPLFPTQNILLQFQPGVSKEVRHAIISKTGATILQEDRGGRTGSFMLDSTRRNGADVLEIANELARDPRVLYAEPDMAFTGRSALTPNDPFFGNLWGLRNTTQFGGVFDADMNVPEAWDQTTGDPSIKVMIIDTGVDPSHPDINLITPGLDTTSDSGSGEPINQWDNHGTPVAGCVSAIINNNIGVVGAAPGCPSMSARCFISNSSSGSWNSFSSWTVNALIHANNNGFRVTNNSNGYGFTSSSIESWYNTTRNNGIVHFASSGNDSLSSPGYPASLSTVVAVGALDPDQTLTSFSNAGNFICAPGITIQCPDRLGSAGYTSSDYTYVQGTSFASPYAAGVAALILSAEPTLTAVQVEDILANTARDLGVPNFDATFGHGLVRADDAVAEALGIEPPDAPGPFDITFPANGATGIDHNAFNTFTWSAASGATEYTVTISPNSDLSGPVVGPIVRTSPNIVLFGGTLQPDTTYYWSVVASNDGPDTTDSTPAIASFSTLGVVVPCDGDINGDLMVDLADFNIMGINFGAGPGATLQQGDITSDGFVDLSDFNVLGINFGNDCN